MVELAHQLLVDAKDGTVQGIIGAVIFHDGTTDMTYVDPPKKWDISVISDRIIGCLERLKFRLLDIRIANDYCIDTDEPEDA